MESTSAIKDTYIRFLALLLLVVSGIGLLLAWTLGSFSISGTTMTPISAINQALSIFDIGDMVDMYEGREGFSSIMLPFLLQIFFGIAYIFSTVFVFTAAFKLLLHAIRVFGAEDDTLLSFAKEAICSHNKLLYHFIAALIGFSMLTRVTLFSGAKVAVYFSIAALAIAQALIALYEKNDLKEAGYVAARPLLCCSAFFLTLRFINLAPLYTLLTGWIGLSSISISGGVKMLYSVYGYPLMTFALLSAVRRLCKEFLTEPIEGEKEYYLRKNRWKKLITLTVIIALLHSFLHTFVFAATRPEFSLGIIGPMLSVVSRTWLPLLMVFIVGRQMDFLPVDEEAIKEKNL